MIDADSKLSIINKMMWDYNISPLDCLAVLEGKQVLAGHYDEHQLFKKLLESFPWYTVMDLLPIERIKLLLTDSLIQDLRSEQLKKRYDFIRTRLPQAL